MATGAWGAVEGMPPLPLSPVRGQMLQLAEVDWPWTGSVWGPHLYAVRRRGGRLLVGATVEEAGFAATPTTAGIGELCDFVSRTFPTLADHPIHSSWAGLRPATPDRLPLLGPWGSPAVWVAGGHFRNGILLAPWTAETVADRMTRAGSGEEADWSDFSPGRFALSPVA